MQVVLLFFHYSPVSFSVVFSVSLLKFVTERYDEDDDDKDLRNDI